MIGYTPGGGIPWTPWGVGAPSTVTTFAAVADAPLFGSAPTP
jgi:hypothetical protein